MSEKKNGRYKAWWIEGKLHREDGPAIEHPNGDKEWWISGKRHREDGPAIEWEGLDGLKGWYLNDVQYTEDEYNHWLGKRQLNDKLHSTLEEKPTQKKNKI